MTRVEGSFTSISWIPSEAMTGLMRLPMDVGIGRYDDPPPDRIEDLETFVASGGCRFANRLEAWAEIEDGRIVDSGTAGRGLVAPTEIDLKALTLRVPAIAFPEIRAIETGGTGQDQVTFVQTAGGRTGAPLPRRTGRTGRTGRIGRPRLRSPTAWTTLALTISADGSTSTEVRGASRFPRHWFYDDHLELSAKSATIDFADWTSGVHHEDTPWGDEDKPVITAEVESALERGLSTALMRAGPSPALVDHAEGEIVMTQGEPARSMGLILDGVVEVEVDGTVVAECGPGSVIGERAFLEGGLRTATIRALTPIKTAEASPETFSTTDLEELRRLHRREHEA